MPPLLSDLVYFVLRPSNAFVLLMAAGLVLTALTPWRRLGLGAVALGLFLIAACGWGPVGALLLAPLETRFPAVEAARTAIDEGEADAFLRTVWEGPAPDGILLLGGLLEPRHPQVWGMPSLNERGDRLVMTLLLARAFPQARVIVTDGPPRTADGRLMGATLIGELLKDLGIDPARLVIEPEARNTWENAVQTRALLDPEPGQRWALVTSAFHMPRAVGAFRAAGWTGLMPVPVDRLWDERPAWRSFNASVAKGLTLTNLAVREYLGLAAYRLAGRSSALLPPRTP